MPTLAETRLRQLQTTVATLEAQRTILGDAAVDAILGRLRQQLAELAEQAAPVPSPPPDPLAELVRATPQPLADKIRAYRDRIEGERRLVTILFTDIVGSTSLAARFDPEEWREIVAGAHRRVCEAVYRYEGTIAQLLGDGVLAFFGAPVAHEDDPLRALFAALDIQRAIQSYAREVKEQVDNFQVRVGVHTGLVVVGNIGHDLHMEYLAIGDSVNLAARLQSVAEPGCILISDTLGRFVQTVFELEDAGKISLKGIAEPVQVYKVAGAKAARSSARGIPGLASPLVGRTREFEVLHNALTALRQGQGRIVTVSGEAGVGKTRLIEEARRAVDKQEPALRWLECRTLSYGRSLSLWPIMQMVRAELGISEADSELTARAALEERLAMLLGPRAQVVHPYLAQLLGLQLEGEFAERLRLLDGETIKRQTIVALAEYVGELAKNQPTVLCFEDLHWADPSTLEALEELFPLTTERPLLILTAYRCEPDVSCVPLLQRAAEKYPEGLAEIHLEALSLAEAQNIVDHLLHHPELPERTRNLILERSEGNPFYMEEIVRHLIEQGCVTFDGERWRASSDIAAEVIPDTLQGILLARIDRLEEDVRHTLQLASVIGREFLYRLLAALAEAEQQMAASLEPQLAELQRVDLVREKAREPELEFMFKHALTQEAAYNSVLIKRRKEFHRRVAQALEQLFAERREELLGLLAHHYDRAGEHEKAIEYLLRAGDKARLGEAHAEACDFYGRAIQLLSELGDDERLAKTWLKLALIYSANFEFDKAHNANETAFDLRKKAGRKQPPYYPPGEGEPKRIVRDCYVGELDKGKLDPGLSNYSYEGPYIVNIFAGLAQMDSELNIIPDQARSWEVLDGGTRYVVHLRDDLRWNDGQPITARDFEWAIKRNIVAVSLRGSNPPAYLLDDIVGARDLREGRRQDPDQVGVQALDDLTLEIRLNGPVAYFPYLLGNQVTFPLPRQVIEKYGDEWSHPDHIVSNGPYRVIEHNRSRDRFVRNPYYSGEFPGNIDEFVDWSVPDSAAVWRNYLECVTDNAVFSRKEAPPDLESLVSPSEQFPAGSGPWVYYVCFMRDRPPMDDVRVRRALILGVDRNRLREQVDGVEAAGARGGLIPAGMAGHSPELGLPFDVEEARRQLAEAGYADPGAMRELVVAISLCTPDAVERPGEYKPVAEELVRQWREHLGIRATVKEMSFAAWSASALDASLSGIVADFPDPHSVLNEVTTAEKHARLRFPQVEQLLKQAARATARFERLKLYREIDRILVREEALVMPYIYGDNRGVALLRKPWLKIPRRAPGALPSWKDDIIEPH